jgi:hypothetical protein
VPNAGDTATAKLTVEDFDATTLATLLVLQPPDDTPVPAVPVSPDFGHTWLSPVSYPNPGEYRLYWRVTGTGAGTKLERVQVGPSGMEADTARRYATTTDLALRLGGPCPDDARMLLRDASELLDRLLLCAVYDTDAAGSPTDTQLREALRDACCEVVRWWIETGDSTGAPGVYTGASMGEISLSRAPTNSRNPGEPRSLGQRVGPQALAILDRCGLAAGEPWHW